MLRIDAKPFLDMLDILVQFTIIGQDDRRAKLMLSDRSRFTNHLKALIAELKMPELDMCRKAAERLLHHVEQDASHFQILHDMQSLRERLLDQIENVTFVAIRQSDRDYFVPHTPLFGIEVDLKFPEMSEDISEAGKCLALGRGTAAVFHLMRVMERALQRLGTELGILLASEKNWQNVLDEANKAIKLLDHKKQKTKALAESASHLYAVKLAWRNEVMHPKQTYTMEQAHEIFRNVRAFVRDLTELV